MDTFFVSGTDRDPGGGSYRGYTIDGGTFVIDTFVIKSLTPPNVVDYNHVESYCIKIGAIIYYSTGAMISFFLLTVLVTSVKVRYYVKFSFYILLLAIIPTACIPYMLFRIRHWKNALPTVWCLKLYSKLLGIEFQVRGKENMVKNSGSIILINHQSLLDLYVLGELWMIKERCCVIAKKELLYFGLFGLATWLWGTIFINRQKSDQAQSAINATANSIRDLQQNVILFPEGHRHSNYTLMPFKKGAFHLAISSQMPIQPVVVSKYYFLNSKSKKFDSGTSYITIMPPICTKGLTTEDLPKLIEKTYKIMNEEFVQSSKEALDKHISSLKSE